MVNKSKICLLIVSCVTLQTAFAIQCYDCSSTIGCDPPTIVDCTQTDANRTVDELWKYFFYVPRITGSSFKCTAVNVTLFHEPETVVKRIFGCINREVDVCELELNPIAGPYDSECQTCSTDLCNSNLPSAQKCYECTGVDECRTPKEVICSESTANQTSINLKSFFSNVKDMRSTTFDCLRMNITEGNSSTTLTNEIRGCVYRELNACSLQMNTNLNQGHQCGLCSGDLCNKNPAAKSTISFFTIFTSLLAVVGLKILVQ